MLRAMKSRRIEILRAGGPEVLALRSWVIPPLRPHQVLVEVSRAGVSFGDVMLRRHVFRDVPKPTVPGYDVVGRVVDANGHPLATGARVAAFIEYGGYAQHAVVPADALVPLPDEVDATLASALIVNYPTAAAMLDLARVPSGDRVLVHGVRGGVGTALSDLARMRHLEVVGTGRSDGDDGVLHRHAPDFERRARERAPGGFAAVFDGNASALAQSHRLVRRGGTLVVFGLSSAAEASLSAKLRLARGLVTLGRLSLFGRGKRTTVFSIGRIFRREPARVRALVADQIALLARGAIAPAVGLVLPLEKAGEAHERLERGEVRGKIVLTVD